MQNKDEKDLFFHNENAVLQIARWAKIVSWAMVVIYLLRFVSDMIQVVGGGQYSWPTAPMDQVLYVVSLVSTLFFGAFYFFVLQGIAQGLYLGLDLFFTEEMEEVEELEEGEA
jgi:hypothetical protein